MTALLLFVSVGDQKNTRRRRMTFPEHGAALIYLISLTGQKHNKLELLFNYCHAV